MNNHQENVDAAMANIRHCQQQNRVVKPVKQAEAKNPLAAGMQLEAGAEINHSRNCSVRHALVCDDL